jgi:Ser/Thr protein kinase RdoA (MazF antagonist)
MPDYRDVRLRDGAREVPVPVVKALGLSGATITALETGSYNIHFRVERAGELFDLRRSNRPNNPGSLVYESAILRHLRQNGFDLAPEIVPAVSGESNLWIDGAGWTLFRWMGDGPGTHSQTASAARTRAAARVLAQFHTVCKNFVPDARRGDWPVFTLPTVDPQTWLKRAESLVDEYDGVNDSAFGGQDLRLMAKRSSVELASIDFAKLPEYMCHGDYRMKNIQFTGDEVTGVFDIDTSIRASRLLDIGGVVTRFSPLGGNPQADVGAGALFLREYHERLPLSAYEIEVLPIFIRWRLLRDVVIYYDRWWFTVRETCASLFDGAAEAILAESGLL